MLVSMWLSPRHLLRRCHLLKVLQTLQIVGFVLMIFPFAEHGLNLASSILTENMYTVLEVVQYASSSRDKGQFNTLHGPLPFGDVSYFAPVSSTIQRLSITRQFFFGVFDGSPSFLGTITRTLSPIFAHLQRSGRSVYFSFVSRMLRAFPVGRHGVGISSCV